MSKSDKEKVKAYTVEITGQFKYTTQVEAFSAEEAKRDVEDDMDLEGIQLDATVNVVAINSVRVISEKQIASHSVE